MHGQQNIKIYCTVPGAITVRFVLCIGHNSQQILKVPSTFNGSHMDTSDRELQQVFKGPERLRLA